jgi:hypothetical protein
MRKEPFDEGGGHEGTETSATARRESTALQLELAKRAAKT